MARIDHIGQNGPTGEHYLVEEIAKTIQRSHKTNARYDWEDFVPEAIAILEEIETYGKECRRS